MYLKGQASLLQTIWYFDAFPVAESHFLPLGKNPYPMEIKRQEKHQLMNMWPYFTLSVFLLFSV